MDVLVWLLLALLGVGNIVAFFRVAYLEKKRLKGKLFSHMWEDLQEQPFAASVGYLCLLLFGSFSMVCEIFFKEPPTDLDGKVEQEKT